MKKVILSILCLCLTMYIFPQIDQQQATILNVAVPVRVLDGERFIDSVSIDDFELYENGILQKIDALYLIKDANTARKEAARQFDPLLNRTFYFLFQLTDWDPNIEDAVEHFFNNVFLPGDSLVIMTPERTFRLSPQAFAAKPKEATSKELVKILRKDIQLGSTRYKTTMRNLRRLIGEIKSVSGVSTQVSSPDQVDTGFSDSSMSLELLLPRYTNAIQEMDTLRFVDQQTFISFANSLKKLQNQKNVYLFYQREFRPEINPSMLSEIQMNFQDRPAILGQLSELFDLYKKDIRLDGEKINQAFADSSLLFNFIFSDKIAARYAGVYMREQSEDIFEIFSEAAKATGGIVESSQNLAIGFKKATEISAQYYLLYYSPVNYVKDGSFNSIAVKVKNQNYSITNRKGYYAR